MRIATFNLFSGRSLTDGQVVASRLPESIAELDVDVLGIQEVDRNQPRSAHVDMTAVVAQAMGARDHRFVPVLTGTPGEDWEPVTATGTGSGAGSAFGSGSGDGREAVDPMAPAYGIGLASRLPVLSWHQWLLPAAPVRSPILVPSATGGRPQPLMLRDEPRAGLAAVVETAAGRLTVATTHLSFVPGWNLVQLRILIRHLNAMPGPVILLGDLNLPGGLPGIAAIGWKNLAHGLKTYPSPAPKLQFDHVFARGPIPPVTRSYAAQLTVSDHRAIVIDLAA